MRKKEEDKEGHLWKRRSAALSCRKEAVLLHQFSGSSETCELTTEPQNMAPSKQPNWHTTALEAVHGTDLTGDMP